MRKRGGLCYLPILEVKSKDKVVIRNLPRKDCIRSRSIPWCCISISLLKSWNKKSKRRKWKEKKKLKNARNLQTLWQPLSSTVISARPSLIRNDRANKFSTVCAKDRLFRIKFSSLALLCLLRIWNIVAIFLSVSVLPSPSVSSSWKYIKKPYDTVHFTKLRKW